MDRFLDENESAASSAAGSPARVYVTPATAEDPPLSTTEHMLMNRVTSSGGNYPSSSSSMMSPLIRISQSYVPTPVIVSNDKEPPTKKPNLGNSECLMMANGPEPLKPRENSTLRVPHIASHVTNHVAISTNHTSHVTNHMTHVSNQLSTGVVAGVPASLPTTGHQFSTLNSPHHLSMRNIESGKAFAQLTQNS